ncbi:MAG: pantoate--beta-alanine ligase [Bacillaceae bacterium]|nr:pantoate--beta-alanine ligase [Bacillaceae bacterium]
MRTVSKINELQFQIHQVKQQGKTIGFVPTMGYLHEGHLHLIRQARKANDFVVLSIFVNPLQFGPNEDFDRYPRDFENDEKLAREAEVDLIFYPDVKEMYPTPLSSIIKVEKGVDVLCGKSRPGHFDGVATVVMKLFNLVQPNCAYFGMKDAQQVAVIETMIKDYNIPVQLVKCETLRENDGLAKSSRNVYLSKEERALAPKIYEALQYGVQLIHMGEINVSKIKQKISQFLNSHAKGSLDYIDILSYPHLEDLESLEGEIIIAVAIKYSQARLIDNITMTV